MEFLFENGNRVVKKSIHLTYDDLKYQVSQKLEVEFISSHPSLLLFIFYFTSSLKLCKRSSLILFEDLWPWGRSNTNYQIINHKFVKKALKLQKMTWYSQNKWISWQHALNNDMNEALKPVNNHVISCMIFMLSLVISIFLNCDMEYQRHMWMDLIKSLHDRFAHVEASNLE